MELYTLDRNLIKQDVIDNFSSLIWTERYFGDSEFELICPKKIDLMEKLPEGIFICEASSDEVMSLENISDEDNNTVKYTGISLLSWMNNRPLLSVDENWIIDSVSPGKALWDMLHGMVGVDSENLIALASFGFGLYTDRFKISQLGLHSYDSSEIPITEEVAFGPLYDAMKTLAQAYEIGMKIILENLRDPLEPKPLGFVSYSGLDRTTNNPDRNPIIRLSQDMDSLANAREFHSITNYKNLALSGTSDPAIAWDEGTEDLSGFDLRVLWLDDPTIKGAKARDELAKYPRIQAVDGEIVSTPQAQFGIHYNLGDIIEIQGPSGLINVVRITEHIRSQDASAEKVSETKEFIQ